MNIILASKSPRRTELLNLIGIKHTIVPSTVEEIVKDNLTPKEIVEDLSLQKATDVAAKYPNDLVIGADTIVVINNKILGKPKDYDDAYNMLSLLQGNSHEVITGVTIIKGDNIYTFSEIAEVTFYPMSHEEIDEYINTKDVYDKAGSYAIQGICSRHIKEIKGDYNTIVGLPVSRIYQILKEINKTK